MSVRPGAPVATADALADVHAAKLRAITATPVRGGCAAGCGVPLDPAARAGGFDRHPGCEPDFVPLGPADLTARIRLLGQLRRAGQRRGRRR